MADKTLIDAFTAAVAECANPPLDSVNPHFKSKFASLASVLKVVRDACGKHGIAVVQPTTAGEGFIGVRTIVVGLGDMVEVGDVSMPANADPQKNGSILTYLRRYSLCSAFGIVGEDDDDGNAAAPAPKFIDRVEAKRTEAIAGLDGGAFVIPSGPNKDKTVAEVAAENPEWLDKALASPKTPAPLRAAVAAFVANGDPIAEELGAKVIVGGEEVPF